MRRLSLFATATALAVLPAAGTAAAAPTCDPARVMVLFDRSTSMIRGTIGGKTKWSLATTAVKNVISDYQSQTEFGLSFFPESDGTCKSGAKTAVNPPARNDLGPITTAFSSNTPSSNSWTPLGQAVKEMENLTSMSDAGKRRFLIIVSDGAQSCPSGEGSEVWATDEIVDHVKVLKQQGITVFVIGFGANTSGNGDDGVDAYTLNQMAVEGGTAIRSCDPSGRDPNADDLCYYQADDADELSAALEEIAIQISEETCDGLDNNCNGQVDENLFQDCSSACGPGTQKCTNGTWGTCNATQPQPEVCDGKDNNCNNVVDEGCACQNGQTKPCGKDTGECELGQQTCVNGQWSQCMGGKGPQAEVCDGLDNDCDGFTDPDCDCTNGTQKSCGGPEIGQCKAGTQTCVNGSWGSCVGSVGPSPEVCDGIDNDCDGMIDEGGVVGDDDDLSNNLCDADQICENGMCIQAPPGNMPPPVASVPGGEPAGCACRTGSAPGQSPLGGAFLAAALAAVLVARRRRK